MKFIDLSMSLVGQKDEDLTDFQKATGQYNKVTYITHDQTTDVLNKLYGIEGRRVAQAGYAGEFFGSDTHAITHLDAPYHYGAKMNNGEPTKTIDEVPLEWCYGDGVVVDFTDKPDGYLVKPEDFEEAFKKINYELKPFDIVLVYTGACNRLNDPSYPLAGCGMGYDATMWLTERGVRVCGTDGMGWDPPFPYTAKEFAETGDESLVWGGHFAGLEREYCHMERLVNLDKLPPYGFKVSCFPVKVKGASAGWVRAVAMIEE